MTTPNQPKILVVDDEAAIRTLLVDVFSDEGYAVRSASNGRAAVAMVEHERPDLIVMDVMMPELDGMETLHRLRSMPKLVNVPVLLMSAAHHVAPDGLDDIVFLAKPFDLDHLLAIVASMLHPAGT